MAQNPDASAAQAIDTGRSEALRHVRYEDLLRAVGSYVDQHGFNDVLITQIPDGVLLKGTVIDRAKVATEKISAVLFTNEDVLTLLEESFQRRGQTDQLRQRWLAQQ